MPHTPHDLHSEFPHEAETLHVLKTTNRHFQTIAERYDTVNHEIHLVVSGIQPASDDHLETLKKQRLQMLDEIAQMIAQTKAA